MANNKEDKTPQGNVKQELNTAFSGLNLDNSINQIAKGQLTYALNATVENFDSSSVNYQNEPGNEFCLQFPQGYQLIGKHTIAEKNKNIFFLVNPNTDSSEIGFMYNNDCIYHKLINANCLNFSVAYPIHKVVHKITNCTTEIYWTDGYNSRRYLDIENIPYILKNGSDLCDPQYTQELDCNQLLLQPNFNIPTLTIKDVISGGSLKSGVYQFGIQYSDAAGNPYTSYYSITNPTPIADIQVTTVNYNYEVGKSIIINIDNLDITGQFQYFNLAVIKTINNIPSVELVGTYYINKPSKDLTYSGQDITTIKLAFQDIFEKYPYYEIAQDVTVAQDILIWDQLTSIDRINYQAIASQIDLQWQTYKIPATENYADELNATNLRGYLRDEVYAFEIVFLLKNGKQTDGFHIPGRILGANEAYPDIPTTNFDFIGEPDRVDAAGIGYSPYWKIYNTASVVGSASGDPIGNATPHQYGELAYWESDQEYPCNTELWGDLAGQKIRHHKFPDIRVSPHFESALFTTVSGMVMQNDAVFPIGVKVDYSAISIFIQNSNLTQEQKDNISGYKIVRGNRDVNKSIIAKGILRNVGEYTKEEQTFYYPNYPYNDLNEDPFLLKQNNAYEVLGQNEVWMVECKEANTIYSFTDPDNGKYQKVTMGKVGQIDEFCSLTRPQTLRGAASIGPANYDSYVVFKGGYYPYGTGQVAYLTRWSNNNSELTINKGGIFGTAVDWIPWTAYQLNVGEKPYYLSGGQPIPDRNLCKLETFTCDKGQYPPDGINCFSGSVVPGKKMGRRSKIFCKETGPLPAFNTNSGYRQIFNSPETSFGQPFLGNVLKLENVMFGKGKAHFVQVKDNAKYKLLSREAQTDALSSSKDIAALGAVNAGAMFTVYQSYLTIYINGITRKNYAYSYNSIANYDYCVNIDNNIGKKQRQIEYSQYLIPTVQSVADSKGIALNNWNRESSVFIKTIEKNLNTIYPALPLPSDSPNMLVSGKPKITDKSRFTISGLKLCDNPAKEQDISVVSYYASMKNVFPGQWGQIYSYDTIDTGFQKTLYSTSTQDVVFGGDTFISRFAFKTKLPFFIDNRVNAPDDSEIFYDEIGNVGYPKYWHSARSILETVLVGGVPMTNIVSYKAHYFDCPNDPAAIPKPTTEGITTGTLRTFYDGYFYLFAYGVPNFYCESSYNTDLRQAFNNREGDFWPHVSTNIPDDWVQESFVSIANDNTYTYNVTFSKQNKENTFTHLPPDWSPATCYTHYPFRTIYSESQIQNADNRVNNWLIYKPLSLFDFPQNYGKLISLDGIQNKSVLARFENKTLLYNNLLTVDTSNPQAAYFGNSKLFDNQYPPIDFAETDLGYVGTQNKMLLKIPQGQVTVDAKRGQVFLVEGTQIEDISAFGSGMNRFFTDHLAFEILRYFPNVNVDNNYSGVGLHGVYDSKFDRVILTKLDYIPINKDVKYDAVKNEFYVETITYINVPITTTTTSSSTSSTTTTTSTTTSTTTTTSSTTTTTTTLYPLVTIGTQIWTAKNLDVTEYANGDTIPQANNQAELNAYNFNKEGCWSYCEYTSANNTTYGKLYSWYAVNDPRGLALVGYHIPSNAEYQLLAITAGGGGALKEAGTTNWFIPNTGATNSSGWTALPGGENNIAGTLLNPPSNKLIVGYFWTSTSQDFDSAYAMFLRWDADLVSFGNPYYTGLKSDAYSVRLIKD